jgi:hypothetical protein
MQAKEPNKPLLMVDIDGVISLFGFSADHRSANAIPALHTGDLDGSFHTIDGIPHFLSAAAAAHLLVLAENFDLVWASGWEEKAEEYLPRLLGLPAGLPFLRFERMTGPPRAREIRSINGHWKLDVIDTYAGSRPLAWIDDAFDESCHAWSAARQAPTLLVQTQPEQGLTTPEAQRLTAWAQDQS